MSIIAHLGIVCNVVNTKRGQFKEIITQTNILSKFFERKMVGHR